MRLHELVQLRSILADQLGLLTQYIASASNPKIRRLRRKSGFGMTLLKRASSVEAEVRCSMMRASFVFTLLNLFHSVHYELNKRTSFRI